MTEIFRQTKATKAWVSLFGTIVTALTVAFADNVFGTDDLGALLTALIPAVGTVVTVYRVPNKPKY